MTDPKETTEGGVLIIGPAAWGGVWGHGPELARYLAGRHDTLYCDPPEPPGPCAPSFHGGDSWARPGRLRVLRRQSRFAPGVLYGLTLEWKNLLAAIRSGAEYLVTYYPLGSILALAWFRLRRRRSMMVYADFPDLLRHRLARILARGIGLRLSAALASVSLATSKALYEDLERFTRNRALAPNGVNLDDIPRRGTERKRLDGTPFTVGFVGFFGEWVDLETVLETAAGLPEVRFVLVGEGPARERLGGREAGAGNVVFTGRLPHDRVFAEIAAMDVCLVPFRVNELTDRVSPVKLFEYWALGRPVLGTPCRELQRISAEEPEALGIYSGAEALARSIRELAGDPERWAEISEKARQAAAGYDWKAIGKRIESLLVHGSDPDVRGNH